MDNFRVSWRIIDDVSDSVIITSHIITLLFTESRGILEGQQCPIHIDFFTQHVPSTMLVCLGVLIREWVGGWMGGWVGGRAGGQVDGWVGVYLTERDKADLWRSCSIVSEPTDVFFIEV